MAPDGLEFTGAAAREPGTPALSRLTNEYDLAVLPPPLMASKAALQARGDTLWARKTALVERGDKIIDVRPYIAGFDVLCGDAARRLCDVFEWTTADALLRVQVRITPTGSAKPIEIAQALDWRGAEVARLGFFAVGADGERGDPLARAQLTSTQAVMQASRVDATRDPAPVVP